MHHLAVVRSLCTQDNSHSAGVARIQRGDPKNRGVTYPYFGSAVAKLLGPGDSGLPPYVWIKPGSGGFIHQDAGFLGPKYGALALGDGKPPENLLPPGDLTAEDDAERNDLRDARRPALRRAAAARRPPRRTATSTTWPRSSRSGATCSTPSTLRAEGRRALRHARARPAHAARPAGCSKRA